jgi:hypothetical protein
VQARGGGLDAERDHVIPGRHGQTCAEHPPIGR